MQTLIDFLNEHGGYATIKEMKGASFHTREIARLLKEGAIEKVKPGLYRVANIGSIDVTLSDDTAAELHGSAFSPGILDICRAIPDGVICLVSALEFHGLTTANPSEIYVAIPHAGKIPKIEYPPVRVFYYRDRFYKAGIDKFSTHNVEIKIYNREKTICDMFRYRKKLGEDLALEGLKNYLKLKDANINRLREYAEICQVKTVMMPYLKALVG